VSGPETAPPRPARRERRLWLGAAVVAVVAAVVVAALASGEVRVNTQGPTAAASAPSLGNGIQLATVTRQTLVSQEDESGTLEFAGNYTVTGSAQGVVTWLPSPGQVVTEGHVLYRVDNTPVFLLYGSVPAWRTLYQGVADGPDIAELNDDLVAMGLAASADLEPRDAFTAATATALDTLEGKLGLPETGELNLGEAVFLPQAIRVAAQTAVVGQTVGPGAQLYTATSSTPVVEVPLDPSLQGLVAAGDSVQIQLPDGSYVNGVVTSVGRVASDTTTANAGVAAGAAGAGGGTAESASAIPVTIRPEGLPAAQTLDDASVTVAITTAEAKNALVVPVAALLAQPSGGYDVAVVDGHHETLVPVRLGLFDDADGLVAVSGPGLAVGDRVTEAVS
jgi:hypothetical protein